MTGRELVDWIHENHAEDCNIVIDIVCEHTYADSVELSPESSEIIIS